MTRQLRFILLAAFVVVLLGVVGVWWWRFRHPVTLPVSSASGAPMSGMTPSQPSASSPPSASPRGDVSLDLRRQQLIGVRTTKVTRAELRHVIRTVGTVRADETRVVDVNVKIEGWIRELDADYTGRFVPQGDRLFTLYSPELLATESEYVLALTTRDQMQSSVLPDAKMRADAVVAAARQRLARWDLTEDDLRGLDTTRQPKDTVSFRAPISGFVTEKTAIKGAHVMPGQTLFKLADLSVVWIEADVYEQDMPTVSVGTRATVALEAYPGQPVTGRVVYVYPFVDEQTRTTKVRYEFPNSEGRLKPGMYATVEIGTSGGMGITVPIDAVLDSGREQVVFVAEGDGYFAPRTVTVGRRLGNVIEILKGLKPDETVATGATFFLDSESQLRGALQGYTPPASTPGNGGAPADRLKIALRVVPDPPKTGENQFEVTVTNSSGAPVADAEVAIQLFMPAMPTMNMPAMRNEVKLSPTGSGIYRGTGQVMMAGRWDATVTVTRAGQRLGSSQTTVVAR